MTERATYPAGEVSRVAVAAVAAVAVVVVAAVVVAVTMTENSIAKEVEPES